jgi:hypothetical protein
MIYPIYIYGCLWVPGHLQVSELLDRVVSIGSLSRAAKMAIVAAPLLLIAATLVGAVERRHPGGVFSLLRSHWPLTVVLVWTLAIVASSALLTSGILILVILIHYTGWYLFAACNLATQPPAASAGITWRTPNAWFKRTFVGFNVFHGGLIVLFSGLILFNHYALGHANMYVAGRVVDNPISFLLDFKAFPYWTIIHITLAFAPLPEPKRR